MLVEWDIEGGACINWPAQDRQDEGRASRRLHGETLWEWLFVNIEWLQAFAETVRVESITKAAQNLHLTQPALSQQLRNLERELGHELLVRSNRGVELTAPGKVLYSYAQSFITLKDNLVHDLGALNRRQDEELSIGTCVPVGQYALPCALYLFKQKYPQVGVRVQDMSTDEVVERLRDHSIAVGFVQDGFQAPDLASHVMISTELTVVAPPDWSDVPNTVSELMASPLILTSQACDIRRSLVSGLEPHGAKETDLRPVLEMDGLEAVKSAVASGHGLAVLPYFAVKKELFTGLLKRVEIPGVHLECCFSVIWRRNEPDSPALDYFIGFLKEKGNEVFC